MGLFDSFKKTEPAAQATTQPATPPSNVTAGGSADNGGTNVVTEQSDKAKNPLDVFNGMFNTKDANEVKAPSFSLPPDKLQEVAKSLNFTSNIDPELMSKALGGDAKSLVDIISHVGRESYSNSMAHLSGLSNEYINSRLAHENNSLGSKVKEQLTNTELGANTPNFNHPVVKQQLVQTAQALAKQHPDASPQEIAKMAKNYISELASAIAPQGTTNAQSNDAASVTDWEKYVS